MSAKENPGAAVGITLTAALFLMRGLFFPDYHFSFDNCLQRLILI